MNKRNLLAGLAGLLLPVLALGQTYNRFAPANGILVGDPSTYVTTAADSADIIAEWSGVCSSSTYLRGDGTCAAAAISGAALTRTNDTNVTLTLGGSPTTALVNATSLTLGWTGTLAASRGGLGMSTVTDDTLAVANGTVWQSKAVPDCDTSTSVLQYDTATNAFSCGTNASPAGAALTKVDDTNVTLTLGGSPTTALVNAASITAGWTGTLAASRGGTGNGFTAFTGPTTSTKTFTLPNASATILTDNALVTVGQGGTGVSSLGNLTKVDDTNVTLTLGGTPTGALINSTSLTLGWSGTLAASRGGLGMSTVTDDTVAVANGTTWQSKALTDCDAATSAVTYDTTTNTWGCNTISGATGANPTATIGLTATNGVASTFLRSDAAPALSQAITPTWTGLHKFARSGAAEKLRWIASDASGDNFQAWYESDDTTRKGYLGYGNAADDTLYLANEENATVVLQTNATTRLTVAADGGTVLGSATGGSQGVGTLNASAIYDDGVQITNQTGANPTGTIGLTAVNGSAGTFLRSDGAPALSQAIIPTWTGGHTFSGSVAGFGDSIRTTNAAPATSFVETGVAANNGIWFDQVDAGVRRFTVASDVGALSNYLSVARSGAAVTSMAFGNATDNPAYNFLSTGLTTLSGPVTLNSAGSGSSSGLRLSSTIPFAYFNDTDAGTDAKNWDMGGASGLFRIRAVADDGTTTQNAINIGRSGANVGTIEFGNTTANGAFTFLGTGQTTFGGTVSLPAGSASAPSIAFPGTSSNSGVFNSGTDQVAITTDGTNRLEVTTTSITSTLPVRGPTGSASAPTFSHSTDTNTGVALDGSDAIILTTNATARVTVNNSGVQVGSPTGGAQGAGTINATGLYVNGVSVEGGATTTGTFSATFTGYGTPPTCTIKYRKTGSQVSFFVNSGSTCTGTSNSTSWTISNLPATITPASNASVMGVCTDNGLDIPCNAAFTSSSTVVFYAGNPLLSTGWTSSGTKGISSGVFIYDLRN